MKEPQGGSCTDLVAVPSPQQCSGRSSPSTRGSGHSLLLLQLRTELEGKWRPDKFGILRRWMNVSPKHWKEDAYDDAMRSGTVIRNVRRSNGQKRTRKRQKDRRPPRSVTTLMERFVQQVSPAEENEIADFRGDPGFPSGKNQRRARRFMLEEEVMVLQKRLQREIDLHLALENAVSPSSAPQPRRPQDIPVRTRELLKDVEALEKVVAALEDQSTALQRELGHERNERESIEQSGQPPSKCGCEQASEGASESIAPKHSRHLPRSRRPRTSSPTVQQHSAPVKGSNCLSSTSVVRTDRPLSPCTHRGAFKMGDSGGSTVQTSSKFHPSESYGPSSVTWKSRAFDSAYPQATTAVPSSDSSSKHSFLSAFDPHNRVQSSAALLQTESSVLPFAISPARYSCSGASTSDQSSSCGPPGGREEDNGSSCPVTSDFFPLPTSPSTPEHRVRPTSPAGAADGLMQFRCDDALPTEEMYRSKRSSRKFVSPPEEQHSSNACGTCGSEEFYSPKTTSSGFGDSLSGDSQPSSTEKGNKVRVKLSLQADHNLVKKQLHKTYNTDDAIARQSLMFELMSPGLQLDILPVGYPAGGHDKSHFKDYSETPNLLSEEMIKCMVSIYWHLADPAVIFQNRSCDNISSPTSHFGHTTSSSSFSSFSESSLLSFKRSPLVDLRSKDDVLGYEGSPDPYSVRGKIPWADIGLYSKVLEVSWMSVSTDQLGYAAQALYKFRLLVEQLPRVDPRVMSHSQKLAFWINLYNSLMMHAYLAYGIPRNDLKYFALLQKEFDFPYWFSCGGDLAIGQKHPKATYNVGGYSFNAATIEYSLLRGRAPSYRPQIGMLMALHTNKWVLTEEQSKFAIDYPEPQIVFSLCSGARSSPAVRLYTAGRVHKEINMALRDYVRATVALNGKGKCLIPKLLYTYAHDVVDDGAILDWVCQFLPASQAGLVLECSQHRISRLIGAGKFAVLPFELSFRYLFAPIFDPSSDLH